MYTDVTKSYLERQAKKNGGDRKPVSTWHCCGHASEDRKNTIPCERYSCMINIYSSDEKIPNMNCPLGYPDPDWKDTHGVKMD